MRSESKPDGQDGLSFIEAARRKQIIESATETIAIMGYGQASLAQIAKRAGISKGMILYHFAGKDELIEQIVTETYTKALQFILPRLNLDVSANQQLENYIRADIAFISSHRLEVTALVEIMTSHRGEDGRMRYDAKAQEPIIAGLEDFLRRGQQEGSFRDFDTRVMAITIRRAIDALSLLLNDYPDLDVDNYAQELVTLFDLATRKL